MNEKRHGYIGYIDEPPLAEVLHIAAGTHFIRDENGHLQPCGDDDPRAVGFVPRKHLWINGIPVVENELLPPGMVKICDPGQILGKLDF